MKHLLLILSVATCFMATTTNAAPKDASNGACDALEDASELFPLCLDAHSALNKVELLISKDVNHHAIDNAQLRLDTLVAEYESQSGGVAVPGFESDDETSFSRTTHPSYSSPTSTANDFAIIDLANPSY